MEEFLSQYPKVLLFLSILGSLVTFISAAVLITPSKKDDAKLASLKKKTIIGNIIDFLLKFSVIQKK